ncbi:MAG: hypothetical protein O3B73_18830 [bacterium]|nr:hypothetical protein [bacterium]
MLSLSSRAKALFLALGIFILGLVCGSMGERWFVPNRFSPFEHMRAGGPPGMNIFDRTGREDRGPGPSIRRLTRDLDLTSVQQESISAILETFRTQIDTVRREVAEKMRSEGEEVQARIREELTEEQRQKFDQMKREHNKRWRGGFGGREGWGGPPPVGR